MNTIGKILVILNFVFAIAVGAFLVFDFATRTQWKRAYDELKTQADVLEARAKGSASTLGPIAAEASKNKLKADELANQLKDQETAAKAQEESQRIAVEDYKNKLKDSDVSLQTVLGEKKRMTAEIALLTKTKAEREQSVNLLEGDVKKFRQEALAQENLARTLQVRLDQIENELRLRNEQLAEKNTKGALEPASAVNITTGNQPAPPVQQVRGKVEKVDGSLVELSVGSDHGLAKNNTLEVFRTNPAPKYVGMVRIIDTYPHRSVARVVNGREPVREGDRVISRITP